MKSIKEFIVPTLTLFLICLVAAFLLGVTNKVTAPRIAEIEEQTKQEAMKEVFPEAASFGADETDESTGCTYAQALDAEGNVIGYAVTAIGKGGYSGDIKLMVGLDNEGKVVKTTVLSQDETPSVGGKKVIANESFFAQFTGLFEKASIGAGNVDAVSGATKTSTGVADAVNNALLCFANVKGGVSTNG